ncbi:hypothetical protein BHE74_00021521 [Ensete ventricosum]|nr:hypothetical protein BHE74_00021521 [Ensete ventricosum]
MSNVTLNVSSVTTSCRCCTESLSIRDSVSSSELSPKKTSMALVEFLQTRFKNIEAGFRHCKPFLVALSRLALQNAPPPLVENAQLLTHLICCRAPHKRLQQLESEFALTADLRLLGAKVRQVIGTRTTRYQVQPGIPSVRLAMDSTGEEQRDSRIFFSLFFSLPPSADTA